jgi:hypothetical protein
MGQDIVGGHWIAKKHDSKARERQLEAVGREWMDGSVGDDDLRVPQANTTTGSFTESADALFYRASNRDALLRHGGPCGIELPIALFDAAGPLVSGNRNADMVRASTFALSAPPMMQSPQGSRMLHRRNQAKRQTPWQI